MSEAYSGEGHEILNPFGRRIWVSKIILRVLDMRGYLRRDKATGLKEFKPDLVKLFLQLERTTYHRELYTALGPDFSGPGVVMCNCLECQRNASDIDHIPLPDRNRSRDDETSRIVADVKSRRRSA